jgi:hypothetical protein
MKTASLLMAAICCLLLPSCVVQHVKSSKAPGASLARLRTFYVQKHAEDGRGIDNVIAGQLNAKGFKATSGTSTKPPANADAHLTYVDHWMWDITMYLLKLDIQITDAKTGAILAKGEALHTSLARKSPEHMAREILDDIFKAN